MIDWVHGHCKVWSRALRRVVYGSRGRPSRDQLRRLEELGFTSALKWAHPELNPPELTDGHSRSVMCAVRALPRVHRDAVFTHYVMDGTAVSKARVIGISRRAYYTRLDDAHGALARLLR